jgi:hypothetical protein
VGRENRNNGLGRGPKAALAREGGVPGSQLPATGYRLLVAPKGPGKVAHFQQLATVQNGLPGTPARSGTCRSPIGEGGWVGKTEIMAGKRAEGRTGLGGWRPWLPAPSSQLRATGYRLQAAFG